MFQLHPWCQQRPIVNYCRNNGIVVQAYCPLTQGVYLNEPILAELAKKVSPRIRVASHHEALIDLPPPFHTQYNKDRAQILIRWSLQMG